jgi:hypothetical protein
MACLQGSAHRAFRRSVGSLHLYLAQQPAHVSFPTGNGRSGYPHRCTIDWTPYNMMMRRAHLASERGQDAVENWYHLSEEVVMTVSATTTLSPKMRKKKK